MITSEIGFWKKNLEITHVLEFYDFKAFIGWQKISNLGTTFKTICEEAKSVDLKGMKD